MERQIGLLKSSPQTRSGQAGFKRPFRTLPNASKPLSLRAYLAASRAIPLLAPMLLRRRLAKGKEDPDRWQEKQGLASLDRPKGRLIWLHAVGLGEVLALRGLIAALSRRDPQLSFLITSTARSSAQVVGTNLPPRTQHQFLPLDAPSYLAQFLDHWQPDLSIWAEQDIWPGAVVATNARAIPIALINARLSGDGFARRARLRGLYRAVMRRLSFVSAQDGHSATRLADLGAQNVQITGSLKPAAPLLNTVESECTRLRSLLADRRIWVAASTHPGDEAEAIKAQATKPGWLLILVPRDVGRADNVANALNTAGISFAQRSLKQLPGPEHAVWLADSYGELGLWYRLAEVALIGGGFDQIGGHNPWEAAALGAAILHGPDVANFVADYAALDGAGAAKQLAPGALAAALNDADLAGMAGMADKASALIAEKRDALDQLSADLLALIERPA
ncbi:MAG: 3-deoxy-D-manno-octulosonic-acid transferase [Paracoccaceae bacterium]